MSLPFLFRVGNCVTEKKVESSQFAENPKIVIPNEVRDLLFVEIREKADSSGKPRPRNDTF